MTIEKDKTQGWYIARVFLNGQFFCGSGKSHTEAMVRCFNNINWKLS